MDFRLLDERLSSVGLAVLRPTVLLPTSYNCRPTSCCLAVLRTYCPTAYVLRPAPYVLRLDVLCPTSCHPRSCLFIQHLFDFRAIFVCHGSFPTAHFILQIVRSIRIL